jgi:tRNA A-37 threonylcarbamoyl transferase component Bud32
MHSIPEFLTGDFFRSIGLIDHEITSTFLIKNDLFHTCIIVACGPQKYFVKISGPKARADKVINCVVASEIAFENDVMTPKLLSFFSDSCHVQKQTISIFEFVQGLTVSESMFEDFSEKEKGLFLFNLGENIASIHKHCSNGYTERLSDSNLYSLEEVIAKRLEYCFSQNTSFQFFSPSQMSLFEMKIQRLLQFVSSVSNPVLIHGDIGFRNLIQKNNKFASIIDFEHAKYHDPAYDFVKLHFAFSSRPKMMSDVLAGYYNSSHQLVHFEERLALFVGLEILSGIPYWHKTKNTHMSDVYSAKMDEWLS